MELLTWILIIVACVWIYCYFKKSLSYFEEYGIPYLPALPLFGNMGCLMFRTKHITDFTKEVYNLDPNAKYIGAFDFTRPVIVLRDPELIKSVAIKNFDNFPDHNTFFDANVDPIFGGNLFNLHGEKWREARNLLSPAFTSSKMKGMFELMVECAQNFVKYISERSADDNQLVETKDLFTKYTNDVIATCAFGISVDSLNNPKNKFYVLGKKATSLSGFTLIKLFLIRAMPKLIIYFKIKFISARIEEFFKDIVNRTVKTRDEKGITRPDMLQLMMDARGKDSQSFKWDTTEMTAQAFVFFFGGFDTISTQMCVISHELVINPDIQQKLQDEIDEILKETNGKPTYEAINGMPYLDAIFNESLRMHTQFGFLDRMCAKAFELPVTLPGAKPFTVPPGMNIWIPSSAIHRDPTYYDDPDTFNPDRYYQKKVTINDVTNLGFGIGPRSCIGNRFAILETKILIFFLLSKFTLKPSAKTAKDFKYSRKKAIIQPEGGFWLKIESRT